MAHPVTLIPGDGVGPEVVEAARLVLEATGVALEWEVQQAGQVAAAREGTPLPQAVLESIRRCGVALKGPLVTPLEGTGRSPNVALRQALDLYACVRPCRLYPGVPSRYEGVDLVVVRENTEDAYTGLEFGQGTSEAAALLAFLEREGGVRVRPDTGLSIKANSVAGSERVVRFAFEYARRQGRRKVTAGHKANILKHTDGLFLAAARRVAADYPDIEFEDRIVDALAMRLAQRPSDFDVLVLPNLYGDILSDLGAGLIGGLGVAPGGHFGDGLAVFEATHGAAPRLAGTGRANPVGLILSGAMLLRHLGEAEAGERLERAVAGVLAEGRVLTYDLRPDRDPARAATTMEVAQAVAARLG